MPLGILLICTLAVAALASSSPPPTCSTYGATVWLTLPTPFDAGTQSYFTNPALPSRYLMAKGSSISTFIIYVNTIDSVTGQATLNLLDNGFMVGVDCTPYALFIGGVVAVVEGKAIFSSLTPADCTIGTTYVLSFSLRSESGALMSSNVLNVSVVCQTTTVSTVPGYIDFGRVGFINPASRLSRVISVNTVLPQFVVAVYNAFGKVDDSNAVNLITLSMTNGIVSPTQFQKSGIDNLFTIQGLSFSPSSTSVTQTTLKVIAVGTSGTLPTPLSASFSVVQETIPNYFMRFDPNVATSFFNQDGETGTAVANVALPPIRVLFYDSKLQLDSSSTGIILTASCREGQIIGGNAVVVQGVATFSSLMFSSNSAPLTDATITFTATSNFPVSQLAPQLSPLYTGAITVTAGPLSANSLQFADRSQMSTANIVIQIDASNNFVLPNIVVLVLDSAYQLDTSANGISLELARDAASPTFVVSSGGTATVSNGIASFGSVTCSNGVEGSTYRVCVRDPTDRISQLCTGSFRLASASASPASDLQSCATSSASCAFSLSFAPAPLSFVYMEGQVISATLGSIIPEVQIILNDQFGPISSSIDRNSVPALIAYTGDDPASERYLSAEGRVAVWQQRRYSFTCLRFARVPVGLVRISFAAVQSLDSLTPFVGLNSLTSGFVRLAPEPTGGFSLRFASNNLVFSAPAERSTAVVNVALPPITIEIEDSDHTLDTSVSGISIQATVSSGALQLDGSVEVMTGGIAVFRLLTFASTGIEPVMTFSVQHTSLPVQGISISTGSILVTTVPIPAAHIKFSPTISSSNNVTAPYSFFVFPTLSEAQLLVAVTIYDSSHAAESVASRSVVLQQSSVEGVLASQQSVTISQGALGTAYFQAKFISFQSGFSGLPLHLKYTVTGGSSPVLVGSWIMVGPLFVAESLDLSTCVTQFYAPVIVAFFRVDTLTFNLTTALSVIAVQLALPINQVLPQQALSTTSVAGLQTQSPSSQLIPLAVEPTASSDPVTLTSWTGTKMTLLFRALATDDVSFSNPSTKSARQLAQALLAYRPTCSSTGGSLYSTTSKYTIQSANYLADDVSCNTATFLASLSLANNCSLSGFLTPCQCYALYSLEAYGAVCSMVPTLAPTFGTLCGTTLADCKEVSVAFACVNFSPVATTSTAVYLAFLALLCVPVAGVAYCIYRRVSGEKVLMNTDRQIQNDEANRPFSARWDDFKRSVSSKIF